MSKLKNKKYIYNKVCFRKRTPYSIGCPCLTLVFHGTFCLGGFSPQAAAGGVHNGPPPDQGAPAARTPTVDSQGARWPRAPHRWGHCALFCRVWCVHPPLSALGNVYSLTRILWSLESLGSDSGHTVLESFCQRETAIAAALKRASDTFSFLKELDCFSLYL